MRQSGSFLSKMEDDTELEVAEEAELSLNASLADSQSTFGDARYRDFDDEAQKVSLISGHSSATDRFDDSDEPRLKYDRLSSDLKHILERDSAAALTVHDRFIVLGKESIIIFMNSNTFDTFFRDSLGSNSSFRRSWQCHASVGKSVCQS